MSTKQSLLNKLSNDFGLTALRPPESPLPPTMPTVEELVLDAQAAERAQPGPRRLLDLFDGVVGDLQTLLADYFRSPQKYEEPQAQLLELLASGSVSLTQLSKNDRLVLNLAVLDFMKPDPVPEPPSVLKTAASKSQDEPEDYFDKEDYDKSEEPRTRSGETPETELSAHWWLS